jgi:hypothetical protein
MPVGHDEDDLRNHVAEYVLYDDNRSGCEAVKPLFGASQCANQWAVRGAMR